MLSPADYAAYSQATGRSYPQSDEEKANMYGEVRDFRRNQTKSDGSPNIAGTLAIGAAALGGIAGAGLLGRKLLANSRGARTRDIPKAEGASGQRGAPGGGNNDLATLKGMQEQVQSAIPQATVNLPQKKAQPAQTAASNPLTDSIVQDNKQAAQTNPLTQSFTADNIQAGAESKIKSDMATGQPVTRQVAAEAADAKAKNFAASAVDTMVEIQENREPLIKQQSLEATDTAFDQVAQDLQSAVQRNEDVPVSSVDLDSSARRFFSAERQKIANELMEDGGGYTPSDVERELAMRVGSKSFEYGPKYTQRKQAMQLFATYGGDLKENLKADSVQVGGMTVPVSELKTEYVSPETGAMVEQKREFAKDQLGKQRLEVTMERNKRNQANNAYEAFENDPEVAELRAKIEGKEEAMQIAAANADMNPGTSEESFNNSVYNAMYDDKDKLELQLQRRSDDMIGYSPAEQGELVGMEAYEAATQRGITRDFPKRLGDFYDEGSRLFFEQNPNTGEIIPETMERRSGYRKQVPNVGNDELTQAASGTGIRGKGARPYMAEAKSDGELGNAVQELRPSMVVDDPQGGIGIYGEQIEGTPEGALRPGTPGDLTPQGNYLPNTKTAKRRPSEPIYTQEEIANAAMEQTTADPYGDVPIAPDYDKVVESLGSQEATEAGRKSILMSEAVRKGGFSNYMPDGKPRRQEPVRSSTLARTGTIDQEVANLGAEMRGLRRAVESLDNRQTPQMGPRSRTSGLPPQQRSIPGVTGYAARQRPSEADKAAQQLESYMARLQRGRSTPLTSEVVLQPKLF